MKNEIGDIVSQEIEDLLNDAENKSFKYIDGWSETSWEKEMESHPFFVSQSIGEETELSPLMKGIQDLKYSPEENTPLELATSYKDSGNYYFRLKKYKFAIINYTEGIKTKVEGSLKAQLYGNRSAAQFHLNNYGSALLDSKVSLAIEPNNEKVLLRAAKCAFALKRYKDSLYFLDTDCKTQEKKEFTELRRQCEMEEKKDRVRLRRQKRKENEERKKERDLINAISLRHIRIIRHSSSSSSSSSSDLTLDEYEPTHPAALRKKVYLNEESHLIWPVLLLYPEFGQTDFIEEFDETDVFMDHLKIMFGMRAERPTWEKSVEPYFPENIKIFFEDSSSSLSLITVNSNQTLLETLQHSSYAVIGGTPSFILLHSNNAFAKEFLKKYERVI